MKIKDELTNILSVILDIFEITMEMMMKRYLKMLIYSSLLMMILKVFLNHLNIIKE